MRERGKDWLDEIVEAANEIVRLRLMGLSEGDRMIQIQLDIITGAVNRMVASSTLRSDNQAEFEIGPSVFENDQTVH